MSFYLAFLYLEIKAALNLQIKKSKWINLSDQILILKQKQYLLIKNYFKDLKGYNSLKKSELEVKQANFKLKQSEQQTIVRNCICIF